MMSDCGKQHLVMSCSLVQELSPLKNTEPSGMKLYLCLQHLLTWDDQTTPRPENCSLSLGSCPQYMPVLNWIHEFTVQVVTYHPTAQRRASCYLHSAVDCGILKAAFLGRRIWNGVKPCWPFSVLKCSLHKHKDSWEMYSCFWQKWMLTVSPGIWL